MFRSLKHYWAINLAVVLAAAVSTAVLTGALLVGDSVRGSLRDLTLDRLGGVDFALVAPRFFRSDLVDDLTSQPRVDGSIDRLAALIIQRGSAVHSDSRQRAAGVNIYGVESNFNSFFESPLELQRESGEIFHPVILNRSLAQNLGAEAGDQIIIYLERQSEIHRESLLGERNPEDLLQGVRLVVRDIVPDRGLGRFSLRPDQGSPLNVFLAMSVLQRALQRRGFANAMLAARNPSAEPGRAAAALQAALSASLRPEDFGLKLVAAQGHFSLQSDQFVLGPWLVAAGEAAAAALSLPTRRALTYLANTVEAGGRRIPYSTVSAVEFGGEVDSSTLQRADGTAITEIAAGEIVLNQWAATDLGASPGDEVRLSYYKADRGDELTTREAEFRVSDIVPIQGLAADRSLTPDFPGIHDQEDMSSWDPPFPVELDWIRPKDEDYWDQYRATPKAFLSLDDGVRLWTSRFGETTSLRLSAAAGTEADPAETIAQFESALSEELRARQADFLFQPVKQSGLEAASGPTDFSVLFISFSFFLIVASILIVGLLFRLGVERRAKEVGLLLSLGYSKKQVFRRFWGEGAVLALLGTLLGLAGAALYAWLLMVALRTWWLGAVGTTSLFLHVSPASLLFGGAGAFLIVALSIWLTLRKLVDLPKPSLLQGVTNRPAAQRRSKWPLRQAWITFVAALLLSASATFGAGSSALAAGLFFGVGALLLISGLSFFAVWCRSAGRGALSLTRSGALVRMSARNTARNAGRSLLSVALVASASFVIVAVGANRNAPIEDSRESGTGGFLHVAESDIPLLADLSRPAARRDLGFSESDEGLFGSADVFGLRLLPGDDTSCLNLYQPGSPRVLGVPDRLIDRGGFHFHDSLETVENPWTLLRSELEPGVIPAFGDYESVMWILHLGLGDELSLTNERGETVRLRLVGLIQNSIFQSEVLIAESDFLEHFPSRSGYSYFLIDAPRGRKQELGLLLEQRLERFGFDVVGAVEKLAGFQSVRNTYLSTFQTLGGLGLLLGTLGLAIVLVRSVIERRGELATLRAFGFGRPQLAWMVVAENGFLLLTGVFLGSLSALIAVAPTLFSGGSSLPWLSLISTLLLILAVGMLASVLAVRAALRIPMLPALRAE